MDEHRKQAGKRLAQIRDSRGLSQEELANKAGLSVKTISRFENGKHDGRRDTVRRIVAALEIEEADLFGPPPDPLGLGQPSQLDRIEVALAEITALRSDVKKLAKTVVQQSRELRALRDQDRRREPPAGEQR